MLMDPNENQDNTTRTVVMLSLQGIVEDELPGEPVNEILGDQPPDQPSVDPEVVKSVVEQARRIARQLQNDTLLQQSINALSGTNEEEFLRIVDGVIEDDITWEKIVVLLCIAGKIIVKMIKARLRQSLPNILVWTWDYFQSRILSWIVQQGGWVSYLSSCSTPAAQYCAIFICGFLFGAFVWWRADRSS